MQPPRALWVGTALVTMTLVLDGPRPASGQGESVRLYAQLLSDRQADVFLTYCTNAAQAVREVPSLQVVPLPGPLAVGAPA